MANTTLEEILRLAREIKYATTPKANTAMKVGGLFELYAQWCQDNTYESPLKYKGTFLTAEEMEEKQEGNVNGDTYFVVSENAYCSWNGTVWQLTADFHTLTTAVYTQTGAFLQSAQEQLDDALTSINSQVDAKVESITDLQNQLGVERDVNIASGTTVKFNFENHEYWSSDTKYLGKLIPVSQLSSNIKIISSTFKCSYAFLTDNEITNGEIPHYCEGTTKSEVTIGATRTIVVPSDCAYLYVYISTRVSNFGYSIYTYETPSFVNTSAITDNLTKGGSTNVLSAEQGKVLNSSITTLNESIIGGEKKANLTSLQKTYSKNFNCTNDSATFVADSYFKSVVIPVSLFGKYIRFVSNGLRVDYVCLTSNEITDGLLVSSIWCGSQYRGSVPVGSSKTIELPDTCTYIYLYSGKNTLSDTYYSLYYTDKDSIKDRVEILEENANSFATKEELNSATKEWADVDVLQWKKYKVNIQCTNNSSKWVSNGYYSIIVPRSELGKKITIASTTFRVESIFLKDNNITAGGVVSNSYCAGKQRNAEIAVGKSKTLSVPDDCQYMYLYTSKYEAISFFTLKKSTDNEIYTAIDNAIANVSAKTIAQSYADNPDVNSGHKVEHFRDELFSFLFFSDIHHDAKALASIKSLYNSLSSYKEEGIPILCRDVLNGGDFVASSYADNTDYYDKDPIAQKFLVCIGNHECYPNNGEGKTSDFLARDLAYSRWIAPNIDKWCDDGNKATTSVASDGTLIVNGTNPIIGYVDGKSYYYKDYSSFKIRLIVINYCDWWEIGSLGVTKTGQEAWVKAVLEDARTKGFQVMIMLHSRPGGIIKNYNKFDSILRTTTANLTAGLKPAVKDFIDAGGVFICYLTGHLHFDEMGNLSSSTTDGVTTDYPNQLSVTVACAVSSFGSNAISDLQRTCDDTNTSDNYCADYITIDTANRMLYIQRYGANRTIYGDTRNSIAYDYAHDKVIRQS